MGYEIRIEPYTYTAGKERRKQLPFPAVLCTLICPPCRLIICLQRVRPIPEPLFLVVKKGTKIRSVTSGSIPSPLSLISKMSSWA